MAAAAWHAGTERRQLPLFGHSVVARSALTAGEVVVEVPRSSCVLRSALAPYVDALAPVYALALALLAAAAPGGSLSAYASMLQGVCSAGIGNSPSFDAETDALLQGTSVASEAALLPARDRWRAAIGALVKQHPEVWPGTGEEDFVAAVALVRSRCVEYARPDGPSGAPPEPVFVPHLDLLNHSTSPNAAVDTVESAEGELTAFRVRALRAVPAGEQLFISYGNLSDARLLAAYGFTVPLSGDGLDTGELADVAFNPHNEVHVRLADVTAGMRAVLGVVVEGAGKKTGASKRKRGDDGAAGEKFGRMTAALERADVLASPAVLTAAGAAAFEEGALKASKKKGGKGKAAGPSLTASLPDELVTAVRAYLLVAGSEEQFDEALGAVGEGAGAPPSDDETEGRALRAVLLRCVERYPTTLNDDLEWLGEYLDARDEAAAGTGGGGGGAGAPAGRGWAVPASGASGAANARIVALGEKALLLRWSGAQ